MSPPIRRGVFFLLWATAFCCCGCYSVRGSGGGGEVRPALRITTANDVIAPQGYRVVPAASGFTFPTGVAFDDRGRPHVVESGYSYGEVWSTPRLIRVSPDGSLETIAEGGRNGPWTGVAFHGGAFYVAEGGELEGGRILRITPGGGITVLAHDLPSRGDHHTNGPAIGPDGSIYFGIGTYTNSGVVGLDNHDFGWLQRNPALHDIPCRDVTLAGENFETNNPMTSDMDRARTGAFSPFGTPTSAGEVIRGAIPCSGGVFRLRPEGGDIELVAWGFRNPFGLAFAPDGRLYVTDNGYDERGSRPVWGAGDLLWRVEPGTWYGWPDFSGGVPVSDERLKPPQSDRNRALLARQPNPPPQPAAVFGVHSSSNGIDFSRSADFGFVGQAFIAQFGDQSPVSGKVLHPVGFKVVRVEVQTGVVHDFLANRGEKNGPASYLGTTGLERPVAVRFTPDGKELYVVDFGIMSMTQEGARPEPGTGVLWRVTRPNRTAGR